MSVEAWRTLNARVAADLKAGKGEIKPARVLQALPDKSKLSLTKRLARVLVYSLGRHL